MCVVGEEKGRKTKREAFLVGEKSNNSFPTKKKKGETKNELSFPIISLLHKERGKTKKRFYFPRATISFPSTKKAGETMELRSFPSQFVSFPTITIPSPQKDREH